MIMLSGWGEFLRELMQYLGKALILGAMGMAGIYVGIAIKNAINKKKAAGEVPEANEQPEVSES